jgi:DNA-binding transcriptional LysR family regulator
MLDEAARRKAPDAKLRIGMPSEFAALLIPRLAVLSSDVVGGAGFEVVTADSQALAVAYQQNELDLVLVLGVNGLSSEVCRWRAPLAWYAARDGAKSHQRVRTLSLIVPPEGAAIHEVAIAALRAAGRKFEVVCASADHAVRAAAAAAGLGIAPMIEGVEAAGLALCSDAGLTALPPVAVSLHAPGSALASAGRRWVADAVGAFLAA